MPSNSRPIPSDLAADATRSDPTTAPQPETAISSPSPSAPMRRMSRANTFRNPM